MPIITAITSQTKNLDRVNLFLDGKFYCGIASIIVGQNRLKVGQEISLEELDKIVFDSEKEKAFLYAMNYVSRYAPTQRQLTNKLYDKGYFRPIVDYVIEKMKKYGYINDLEYAKCYAGYNKTIKGPIRIKADLRTKGISVEIIEQALSNIEFGQDDLLELAKKHSKNQNIDDPKYQAKLGRYLTYRGYQWSEISTCINTLKKNQVN